MHRYLITGGAGFIGSNVADHYLSSGYSVTILDDFSRPGSERNLAWLRSRHGDACEVIRADIRVASPALSKAAANADVVFHLAAQVAVTTSVTDPRHDFEVNALGTFNVLEAARLARSTPTVIYSSTNKVYGKLADLGIIESNGRYTYATAKEGIAETRPLDPYSPYGCSKCAGDQYVLDYARIYGLKTIVFRQSCIYGPRQFGMEDQGWLAWFSIRAVQQKPVTIYGDGKQVRDILFVEDLIAGYEAALNGRPLTIYGDGLQVRDILFVEDLVEAMLLAHANFHLLSGLAFNFGGGPDNSTSLVELLYVIGDLTGERPRATLEPWRTADQRYYVSDTRKFHDATGWRPQIGVRAGVAALMEWLVADRAARPMVAAAGRVAS
jgi:CDP-paratose 2-epimerase